MATEHLPDLLVGSTALDFTSDEPDRFLFTAMDFLAHFALQLSDRSFSPALRGTDPLPP
jgi:hypothetical protein